MISEYVASYTPLDKKAWENTINVFFLSLYDDYITEKEQDHDLWNTLDERKMVNGESVYNVII